MFSISELGKQKQSRGLVCPTLDAVARMKKMSPLRNESAGRLQAIHTDFILDAISVLDDTSAVLMTVRDNLRSVAEPVIAASSEYVIANRALLADDYEDRRQKLLSQTIDPQDAAAVLLGEHAQEYAVRVDQTLDYRISTFPLGSSSQSLNLPAPKGGFRDKTEIRHTLIAVETVLERLDRKMKQYDADRKYLHKKLPQAT